MVKHGSQTWILNKGCGMEEKLESVTEKMEKTVDDKSELNKKSACKAY